MAKEKKEKDLRILVAIDFLESGKTEETHFDANSEIYSSLLPEAFLQELLDAGKAEYI